MKSCMRCPSISVIVWREYLKVQPAAPDTACPSYGRPVARDGHGFDVRQVLPAVVFLQWNSTVVRGFPQQRRSWQTSLRIPGLNLVFSGGWPGTAPQSVATAEITHVESFLLKQASCHISSLADLTVDDGFPVPRQLRQFLS